LSWFESSKHAEREQRIISNRKVFYIEETQFIDEDIKIFRIDKVLILWFFASDSGVISASLRAFVPEHDLRNLQPPLTSHRVETTASTSTSTSTESLLTCT